MNVDLTPELEKLIRSKVQSGRYDSVSEVIREALQLLDQRDQIFTTRKEEYREQIEEGWLAAASFKTNRSAGATRRSENPPASTWRAPAMAPSMPTSSAEN